jgi:WD40 repeat protein
MSLLKRKNIFILLVFVLLISACSGAQSAWPAATGTQAATITSTSAASMTPQAIKIIEPLFTAISPSTEAPYQETPLAQCPPTPVRPTLTPTPRFYPTLLPEGPYLLCDTQSVIVMNVGTDSRRVTDLPDGVSGTISPDGKWIVYYTGSTEPPYDLALHVFSIEDGTSRLVANILSPDYPENLAVVAEWHSQQEYYYDETPYTGEQLKSPFDVYSTRVVEWSPDGRYLAFSGQMDGPSSDLYIYDVQTDEIRRMTADLRILSDISWSPTGEWLVIENITPSYAYFGKTLHRIRAGSGVRNDLPILEKGSLWKAGGWGTATFYMLIGVADGAGDHALRYLNVETGRITELWPDEYFAYAVDPENQRFIVSGIYEYQTTNSWEREFGTYLVSANGQWEKITDIEFYTLAYRGGEDTRFIGFDGEEVVAISGDGKTTKINDNAVPIYYAHILVSPDRQWFVTFWESGDHSMVLYSANDQPVRTFSEIDVTGALWFPDSSRLFVSSNGELYIVEVPDGTVTRFEMCSVSTNSLMWIP